MSGDPGIFTLFLRKMFSPMGLYMAEWLSGKWFLFLALLSRVKAFPYQVG